MLTGAKKYDGAKVPIFRSWNESSLERKFPTIIRNHERVDGR